MDWERKEIDVARLAVDLGNFRIGDQETIRAAYQAMLAEQEDNLVNLAADLIENGTNPSELPIVCPDSENSKQYVVVEGNRRLTAIRLLETPALAAGTRWHQKFVDLARQYSASPVRKLYCVVMPDKASALKWIERKHRTLGGRGLYQWGADATSRADAFRGKVRPSKAVLDHLRAKGVLSASLAKKVQGKTTNLDRVFQMPYLGAALGIQIAKEGLINFGSGDDKRGTDLLLRMVKAMSADGFTVDKIKLAEDRKDFIDTFGKYGVLAPSGGPAGSGAGGGKSKPASKSARKTAVPIDRDTLAIKGKTYALRIGDPRLAELYQEALRLQPAKLANTGGVLTRVFLELSTDHFLIHQKVPVAPEHLAKGRKAWTDIGISLKDKIAVVLKHVDPTGKEPSFKEVRRGLSDTGALHSVQALHDYVHSLKADPDPTEIKRIWGRWHPYFAAIFDVAG
jgi:hypothetical protein